MAIPLDGFTDPPVVSAYLPPLTDAYNPLSMRATGGIAINDGSQGREVQFWTCRYEGGNINVIDAVGTVQYSLPVADVRTCCLAFDSNMAVAIAYMKDDGGYLYFWNGLTNQYETLHNGDITSCRVCVDKTSRFFEGQSDVVFAYVSNGTSAHYRYQRERYVTEHDVDPQPDITTDNPLIRLGPTEGNRLQFEFFVEGPPPPPPPPGGIIQLPKPTLQIVRVVRATPAYS